MSRWTGFFIFRILIPIILFTLQLYLHRRAVSFLKSEGRFPAWITTLVTSLFLLFNAPLVVLLFHRVSSMEFSKLFMYCAVLPFYVWHGATFFIFLVLGIIRILQLPF